MNIPGVLRLCGRCEVAGSAPTCWVCGGRYTGTLTPPGSGAYLDPVPAAQPHNKPAPTERTVR